MARQPRDYAAEYARRKAARQAKGTPRPYASEYAKRNARAQALGYSSYNERRKDLAALAAGPRAYARRLGYEGDPYRTPEQMREQFHAGVGRKGELLGFRAWAETADRNGIPESVFERAFNEARKSGWNTDPNGKFADLLVLLGMRDPQADYDVGDTP